MQLILEFDAIPGECMPRYDVEIPGDNTSYTVLDALSDGTSSKILIESENPGRVLWIRKEEGSECPYRKPRRLIITPL
jgi:hypothetical protein